MTDPLDLFWQRCEGPKAYGVNDCCMTLADVILAAGGPDLMAQHRGRYRTRLGFVRAVRKAGHQSLPDAILAVFAAHGKQVDEPRDFDVAMVGFMQDGEPTIAPAFFHSGFWMLRDDSGALCTEAENLSIYRVI